MTRISLNNNKVNGIIPRDFQEQLKSLIKNARFGIVLHDLNRIICCSKYIEEALGYTESELRASANYWNLLAPEFRQHHYSGALNSYGKEDLAVNLTAEIACRNGQRKVFALAVSAASFANDYAFQTNMVDITPIIKTKNTLKEKLMDLQLKESKYRQLVYEFDESFVLVDPSLRIVEHNPAFASLLESDEKHLKGCNLLEFAHSPCDQTALLLGMDRRLKHMKDSYDVTLKTSSSKTVFVRIIPSPLVDGKGQVIGSLLIIKDLTSSRQSRLQVYDRNQLLVNIIHDIRIPVTGIIGASELLSQENLTGYQQNLVNNILCCSQELADLVSDFLDLSRLEAGYREITPQDFLLDQVLNECIRTVRLKLQLKNLHIQTEIASHLPVQLAGDPSQLKRIILNLLSNAIKFTSEGTITIRIQPFNCYQTENSDEIWLLFSVEDTGVGIPPEKINTIFEAFQKVNNHIGEGAGLGLAICKNLVELMGGKIWVESEVGQGTKFSFYLPLKKSLADALFETSQVSAPAVIAETEPHSILVVEDNSINRQILAYMLEKCGYRVTLAPDGKTCLEILSQNEFDLILMDMKMPIMDGYQTCHTIRANHQYDHIPIMALTAYSKEEEAEKCFEAGCNHYLSKPVTMLQLQQTLAGIFENKQLQVSKNKPL